MKKTLKKTQPKKTAKNKEKAEGKKETVPPLFQRKIKRKLFKAYEWNGEGHYPCSECPLLPCGTKPAGFPSCVGYLNRFGKNLRWEVVITASSGKYKPSKYANLAKGKKNTGKKTKKQPEK